MFTAGREKERKGRPIGLGEYFDALLRSDGVTMQERCDT